MKTILVAGDLICDNNLVHLPGAHSAEYEPLRTSTLNRRLGGAWYLRDLIREVCPEHEFQVVGPFLDPRPGAPRKEGLCIEEEPGVAQAHAVWMPHPRE